MATATCDAERLVASLRAAEAAERSAAFAELDALVATSKETALPAADADAAAGCVSALCGIMCMDAAQVDAAEYQRASMLISSLLTPLGPVRVGSELLKPGHPSMLAAWTSSSSVLGSALAKAPKDLTEADATAITCATNLWTAILAAGTRECLVAARGADADLMAWVGGELFAAEFLMGGGGQAMVEDDRNMKVAALTLGMLREERIPPGLIRAAWCTMTQALAGRLAVAQRMLDLRVVELAVEHLSRFTPEQWVSSSAFCQNGWTGTALIAIKDVIMATAPQGVDITPLLVSSGYADALVSALKAIEHVGVAKVNASVAAVFVLQTCDAITINDGRCLPQIQEMMRSAKSALRFCAEEGAHLAFWADAGLTTGVFATLVAASLYGKDEEGAFEFKQKDVDDLITITTEIIRPATFGAVWPLNPKQLRGVRNLCISDRHKALLLNSPGLFPLIVDAALLDCEHPRKGATDDTVLATIQTDAAECLLQLAAFGASRARLQQDAAAMETIRALATCGKALTQECEEKARSALLAIEGMTRECDSASTGGGGGGGGGGGERRHGQQQRNGHVMMSYQWDVQEVIKKIVASLERRKYAVWFDLNDMKGGQSIVDSTFSGQYVSHCATLSPKFSSAAC